MSGFEILKHCREHNDEAAKQAQDDALERADLERGNPKRNREGVPAEMWRGLRQS